MSLATQSPGAGESPDRPGPARLQPWLAALLLLAAALVCYRPAWHGKLLWDDDGHVTAPALRPVAGLWRIWFEPGATQQYYPLLHTAFWAEHRIWGDSVLGYHLANIVLHAAAAWILFLLLRRLAVPGAFLGAALFVLHPAGVESVAWISEQKNTLSAVFFLGSALAYLRFDGSRRPLDYLAATALFAAALLTKSVTATLPAALLVLLWWKRGRLGWRRDAAPLAPWLAAGAAMGAVTAWVERAYIGAQGDGFSLSLPDRLEIAGRAPWFYLSKLAWPAGLTFIYPRWDLGRSPAAALLPGAALAGIAAVFFLVRQRSRAPLAVTLLFVGVLFPALGFVNVYPFVYSFVADHFQYLASAAVFAAAGAALASALGRVPRPAAWGAFAALAAALGILTSRQASLYSDPETLWLSTIERNPSCWMAFENLGGVLLQRGHPDQAEARFRRALELNPGDLRAVNQLGVSLLEQGQAGSAVEQFQRALAADPSNLDSRINLGVALLQEGDDSRAAEEFERALLVSPRDTKALRDLATARVRQGRWEDAARLLRRAAEADPGDAQTALRLASALARTGDLPGAEAQYRRALGLDASLPGAHRGLGELLAGAGRLTEAQPELESAVGADASDADACNDLGAVLMEEGRTDEALARFDRALSIRPSFADALVNRGNLHLKLRQAGPAADDYLRALEAGPDSARVRNNLGIALAGAGRREEAVQQFRRAVQIDPGYVEARRNLSILLQGAGPGR
jgi:Tfp pilus assembly protein PilF